MTAVQSISPIFAATTTDDTTVEPLQLLVTIENISVISPFSGDDNANNQASLSYRVHGAPDWISSRTLMLRG